MPNKVHYAQLTQKKVANDYNPGVPQQSKKGLFSRFFPASFLGVRVGEKTTVSRLLLQHYINVGTSIKWGRSSLPLVLVM